MSLVFTGELSGAGLVAGREIAHSFFKCRNAALERLDALENMGADRTADAVALLGNAGFEVAAMPPVIAGVEPTLKALRIASGHFIGRAELRVFTPNTFLKPSNYADSTTGQVIQMGFQPHIGLTWQSVLEDFNLDPSDIPKFEAGKEITPADLDFYRYGVGQLNYLEIVPAGRTVNTYTLTDIHYGFETIEDALYGGNHTSADDALSSMYQTPFSSHIISNLTIASSVLDTIYANPNGQIFSGEFFPLRPFSGTHLNGTSDWASSAQPGFGGYNYAKHLRSPSFKDNLNSVVSGEIKQVTYTKFLVSKTGGWVYEEYVHEQVCSTFDLAESLKYIDSVTAPEKVTPIETAGVTINAGGNLYHKADYSNCFPSRSSIT